MRKHLTILTASSALLLPFAALARDAVNTDIGVDSLNAGEPATVAVPYTELRESVTTEAQLRNKKLEEAEARYKSGQVGRYVYVPSEPVAGAPVADSVAPGDEADEEDDKSWSVFGGMAFDLGIGVFTKNEHARKVRSRFAFSFGASYTIPVIDVRVAAETGFSQWLTKAGGTNGQYEFRWADTTVGLSRKIWTYKDKASSFRVGFDADLSFALPTSKASINDNLYTTIMPTLGFDIGIAGFSFNYMITYAHSFHEYTSATGNPSEIDILSRSTGNELLGTRDVAMGGVLPEIQLVNMFALRYRFIKQLSLSVGFGFSDTWTYDNGTITKGDDLVGIHSKVGRGHSQSSLGSLTLEYVPIKYVALSLGMTSEQPWKTADNRTIRFPWYDTVSPSKNYTKFVIGASFVY